MPLIGSDNWPSEADHRQIRRWIVRLLRPGYGSGSGIMVGPDLVLTCHHVLEDLFSDRPERAEDAQAAAAEVVATVGLGGGPDGPVFKRGLCLFDDGESRSEGPAWHLPMGQRAKDMDFALLCLDDVVAYDAAGLNSGGAVASDWLGLQEFQSPSGLAAGAAGATVSLFMYHYPDPATGSPEILPMLSTGELPAGRQADNRELLHHLDSEVGSSGAMLFAQVAGNPRPFPIAMHRAGRKDGQEKYAVPISAIMGAIEGADPTLFRQLTTPPVDVLLQHRLKELAAPKVTLARSLLDREAQAGAVVRGRSGRRKPIQPVYQSTVEEMTMFQQRLKSFDLPLRVLQSDPDVQSDMRTWTLAGASRAPPVEKGVPKWGISTLGGENWLLDGPVSAISAILDGAEEARSFGSSILMTAQIDIRKLEDYKALEELLVALELELRGPEAEGNFLVLLWICDAARPVETAAPLTDPERQKGREVLRGLWRDRKLGSVVGMPVELGAVARTDLDPWAQDIVRAFGVGSPEVGLTINQAWGRLDQTPSSSGRHDFGRVLRALDAGLQNWVYQYFRRLEESSRIRR